MLISHDTLFYIFTDYLTINDYLNNLMLICKHWFELTEYETFWIKSLKNSINSEIENENLLKQFILTNQNLLSHSSIFIEKDLQQEIDNLIKKHENFKELVISKLVPFTKKKETNEDIYGTVYKNKTKEFIRQINKRKIFIEILKNYLEKTLPVERKIAAIDYNYNKYNKSIIDNWQDNIIPNLEQNKLFSLKEIGQFIYLNNLSVFSIALLSNKGIKSIEDWDVFYTTVVKFFIEKCDVKLSFYLKILLQCKLPNLFCKTIIDENLKDNSMEEIITKIEPSELFEFIKKEIKKLRKLSGFPEILIKLFIEREDDFPTIYLLCELFKEIKEFKLIQTLQSNCIKIVKHLSKNLNIPAMKYVLYNLELINSKDFKIELLIEETLKAVSVKFYSFVEKKEKFIVKFCNELAIDRNNSYLINSIHSLFRVDGFSVDFLNFILKDVKPEILNQPLVHIENPTLLISLLTNNWRVKHEIIEILLDKGALINAYTNNNYWNENTILNEFIPLSMHDSKDYIRVMRKLINAGGKINSAQDFFFNLGNNTINYLLPVEDLKEIIIFFMEEVKVTVIGEDFSRLVERVYPKEKQDLKHFMLDRYNIDFN